MIYPRPPLASEFSGSSRTPLSSAETGADRVAISSCVTASALSFSCPTVTQPARKRHSELRIKHVLRSISGLLFL